MVLSESARGIFLDTIAEGDLQKLLVVVGIPAFDEEKTIARVVLCAQKHADVVVVCDDGSSDMTGEIAMGLGAVVLRHERNLGYGAALQSLFKEARKLEADVLVTFDGDGQHDPGEISRLVTPIEEGVCDVVLGSRFLDKNGTMDMPKYRELGIKVITKLLNGNGKNGVSDAQSGYRAYNKRALKCLSISEKGMSASVELLKSIRKCGLVIGEVPVSCQYSGDVNAKSFGKNPLKHGVSVLMSIVRLVVEDKPMRYLGLPGAIFVGLSAIFGFWLLAIYAETHAIVTNIGLATVGFVLVGFFMLSTAITLYAINRLSKRLTAK